MMIRFNRLLILGLILSRLLTNACAKDQLDAYNIIWDSPSQNSSESMPVGGHSIGLNVWVEDGDVLFYAQRSGSFNENNEYHKLGRFRLSLAPNPFAEGCNFSQELKLRQGYAEMTGQTDAVSAKIKIWVEAKRPVIHVDVDSDNKTQATIAYENWRLKKEELVGGPTKARFGCFSWDAYPGKVYRYPDNVMHDDNSVLFYHRNQNDKLLFDFAVKQQGLSKSKNRLPNTQKGRTYGGRIIAKGFVEDGTTEGIYTSTPYKAWKLRSQRSETAHKLEVYTHVEQTQTLEIWKNNLNALIHEKISNKQAFEQTVDWWENFWERSWLKIDPEQKKNDQTPWSLGRNYQLFRYQLGCNYYGDYPSKFNGGNFTFDPVYVKEKRPFSPDWRAWGGGSFTAQNQRLLYWPLLKTGDYEAMKPQFDFYRRMVPTGKARAKTYWGHEGLLFNEQIENFGLPIACAWGWSDEIILKAMEEKESGLNGIQSQSSSLKNPRKRTDEIENGILANKWISYHYESQLEFSYMILEFHRYTGADISPYMEFIKESVKFFDEHYQMRNKNRTGEALDADGKLVIFPSTACETYKMAKNPVDVIAGLRACLNSLLTLNDPYVTPEDRTYYQSYLDRIPEYSYEIVEGDKILKPAQFWKSVENSECPQFYPLFPFNRFDLDDTEQIKLFQNTWEHGTFRKDMVKSWHQDGIFFARMGMTDEARDYNTRKMKSANRRFPTFWGPGHDWVPDHNWGGSGMIGLQEMLMQTTDGQIHLFPAWPTNWDVDFKLHAPQQTVVEGRLKDGRFTLIKITPESRKDDIVNHLKHTVQIQNK